jgi:hypothetical protein
VGAVAAVAHHSAAAAAGAAQALRPRMLPHQGEALGVVDQRRKVDQVRCGHGGNRSFDGDELPSCSYHSSIFPAQPAFLPFSTPVPDKSLVSFDSTHRGACENLTGTASGPLANALHRCCS